MPKVPALKTSIYLDEVTKGRLEVREATPGSRSEVIRLCIDRYDEICTRMLPRFSADDWKVILAALTEQWLEGKLSPIHVPATVEDLNVKGARALGVRLRTMSFAQWVAIIDKVTRYWIAKARGVKETLPLTPSM
jgi:hypothetical protein